MGRPRKYHVDVSAYACPHEECKAHGAKGAASLRLHGKPRKDGRFRLRCTACGKTFSNTRGTALYYSKKSPQGAARIAQALVDGGGIRSVARVCRVNRKTVSRLLRKAGHHAVRLSRERMRDLRLSELQFDELASWVFKKQENLSKEDLLQHPDAGRVWVSLVIDAATKLAPLAWVSKKAGRWNAQVFFQELERRVSKEGPFPVLSSDQRRLYERAVDALIRKKRGDVVYWQVRSKGDPFGRRDVQLIFGDPEEAVRRLAASPVSSCPNAAFIERFNGTLRLSNRRLQRKINGISKSREMLSNQVALFTAHYNLCKPHKALRVPASPNGHARKWDQRTPAQAAGVAEHRWSVQDLLLAPAG